MVAGAVTRSSVLWLLAPGATGPAMRPQLILGQVPSHMGLDKYRRKRNFGKTSEPPGAAEESPARQPRFTVQKHHARRLHYDLRLEIEGVLRSWAVPKGPSLNPQEKRLAVQVEDHPLKYGDFEGVIPAGQYGAGKVIVWDQGAYECLGEERDCATAWKMGKLDLRLHGHKLRGMWLLVKLKGKEDNQWLLFKKNDEYADLERDIIADAPQSVLTGLDINEIDAESAVTWHSRVHRLLEELQIEKREIRGQVGPMLATLVGEVPKGSHWIYELKYDGIRVLAEKKRPGAALLAQFEAPQSAVPGDRGRGVPDGGKLLPSRR